MKKTIKLILAAWILLPLACARVPKVKREPKPALTVDFQPFTTAAAGCRLDRYQYLCDAGGDIGKLGCEVLYRVDELGGVSPRLPIAQCDSSWQPVGQGAYVRSGGGMIQVYTRYVFVRDGKFQLARNAEELKQLFAPIESADEALSYALAATGLHTFHGFQPPTNYRYETRTLRETFVEKRGGDFVVHNLLATPGFFGCRPGPRMVSMTAFSVSAAGEIRKISDEPAYSDPSQDNACYD